jgi:3-hydroxybutyryl-CoA dehydrogenase
MTDCLYLTSNPEDAFMRQGSGSACSVKCLDKIPAPGDIKSQHLVVEAFSDEKLKIEALRAIARFDHWNGPVASLLYRGSATQWAARSGLGERLVGFYACPSPEDIRSAELLAGETTQSEALKQAETVFSDLGFSTVICKDRAGGILPRVLAAMINEAASMVLLEIASMEEIDQMMRLGANFPMGPFEWADQIGLDRVLATLEELSHEYGPLYHPCPWIRRKVEAGHCGKQSGQGFYPYPSGGIS